MFIVLSLRIYRILVYDVQNTDTKDTVTKQRALHMYTVNFFITEYIIHSLTGNFINL